LTNFQAEVVKIVLDKGLLAAIIAGVVYVFSRMLESQRAGNAYYQYLAQERINAFKTIAHLIAEDLVDLAYVVDAIEKRRENRSENVSVSAQRLMDRYNRFSQGYAEKAATLQSQAPFISKGLAALLTQRQKAVAQFILLVHKPTASTEALHEAMQALMDETAELQSHLATEMKSPPRHLA
jgi:hypothetical protein